MKQMTKTLLFCLLIISCNEQVINKNKQYIKEYEKQIQNTNSEQPPVNFFDKKFATEYKISFGDEDISEYPYSIYYNYNDKNVQWFSISYIPKEIILQDYWKDYLQGKSDLESLMKTSVIGKALNRDLSKYNIFATKLNRIYFEKNESNIGEDIYFKKKNEASIYYYNQNEKKWEFKKKINKEEYYMGSNLFFLKNFPALFSEKLATLESLQLQFKSYKIQKEVKCDLNKDGLEDLVIVFEPLNNKKANENDRHIVNSPFCVMINQGNGKYLQFENKKIIYTSTFNCPDFVVDKLEVKDNYVILQQGTCDEFDRIIKDNMTFKFNSETNEITLDKYKRSLFERLDKSEFLPLSKTLIAKDFGKVLFENYDSKIEYDKINSQN
ncbi:hypothetical protein HNQ02_002812 [Flavobacterium sp. 7E]|uniref:hypothetical protein n=1 Tax=Flavobacterium sp. 7E TaxID=2735898 RepID=UPI001C2D1E1E|nr:hypothetical protein [Flavobacterium sp. 7E]NRS89878.1 hypothetical protein [Flavobacterium sp. 7E]